MTTCRTIILVYVASLVIAAPALGQLLPFTHYTPGSEVTPLPSAEVIDVDQDRLGFIWMAVFSSGLVRYDGHVTELFTVADGLRDLAVRSVTEDLSGRLWVSSDGGLVVSTKPLTDYAPGERIRFTASIESTPLLDVAVSQVGLAIDSRGHVWAGTGDKGIVRYSFSGADRVTTDTLSTAVEPGGPNLIVNAIEHRRNGSVWVAGQLLNQGYLLYFKDGSDQYEILRAPDNETVNVLYDSPDSSLWIGTRTGSVWHLPSGASTSGFRRVASGFDGDVTDFNWSAPTMWIATAGSGVIQIATASEDRVVRYNRRNGFLSETVHDIMVDREGNRWFAQSGGVSKLRANYLAFKSISAESETGEDPILPAAQVNSVINGSSRSGPPCDLWVGTSDGLVCVFEDGTSDYLRTNNGLRHNQVNAVTRDGLGRLWLGTYEGINGIQLPGTPRLPRAPETTTTRLGGFRLSVGGYRRTTIQNALDMPMSVRDGGDETVHAVWFPGYRSIYLLIDDQWYVFRATSGLPATYYNAVAFDADRHLWVGTRDYGLYRTTKPLTLETLKQLRKEASPLSLGGRSGRFGDEIVEDIFEPLWEDAPVAQIESLVSRGDGMWIGTPNGVFVLDSRSQVLVASLDRDSGLPASNALSMAISLPTGNVWVGTNGGLAEVDGSEHAVLRAVTKQDGLIDNEVWYYGSVHVDEKGIVYYGTAKGLTVYDPDRDGRNQLAPSPQITSVGYRESRWGNNEFTTGYTALSFANERQVKYRTRLVGYDEEWSEPTDEHKIRYTNLPAWVFSRDYTFELTASNNHGVWSPTPVRYVFSVRPAWFLSWWAFALYLLLAGGGVYAFIHHKTKVQAQQLARERKINERLRRIDRLKDEFLANTSHELRTPLNGIIGIAESMMDGAAGALSGKAMSNVGLIVASGKRLATLVNDILDFSKLKEHELELQRKAIDVSVVGDIVLRVSDPLIEGKDLILKNEIPRDLPPAFADENRLQQILYNLVGNAIKFTQTGSVVLSGREEDEFLEISVQDTGIGIPAEKHEAIFQSFEQVDASTAREYGGTGLGLAVTRQLVELHGGHIRVESTPGSGSTFYFTLPITDELAEPIESAEMLARVKPPTDDDIGDIDDQAQIPAETNGEAINVLVVDDEPINQQVMVNQLSVANYRVTQALNGEEALRALDNGGKFDLVLLDVMMPRMSGFEVCNRIRETYLPSELPVIMVTAKNQVADLVEGLSSGANDYVTKPISKSELLARIKTQLNLQKINAAYGRFVPHEFLRYLNRESIIDVRLGDMVQKEMTIFVSDIRRFTTLSEKMTPEENFEFINAYLAQASPVIRDHGGFIDRYTGDAIMALFPDEAEKAIKAAIDTLQLLSGINEVRAARGELPIEIGIGLHSGSLMLGIVGEQERAQGDIFSDAVNLANRIEGLSKLYGASLVVSEETLDRLPEGNKYHQRFLGKVQVKGKNKHVAVFEVYDGDPPEMIELKLKTKADFEEGLANYFGRDFTMASVCFKKVLDDNPADKTASLYLRRSAQFMIQGVPDHWEGVEAVDEISDDVVSTPPVRRPAHTSSTSPARQQPQTAGDDGKERTMRVNGEEDVVSSNGRHDEESDTRRPDSADLERADGLPAVEKVKKKGKKGKKGKKKAAKKDKKKKKSKRDGAKKKRK